MHKNITTEEWEKFKSLSGSAQKNFESLWYSLVVNNYSKFGKFIKYKNTPGVEFYLELYSNDTDIGKNGDVVGWQCKFFEISTKGNLTKSQKTQIEDSLKKTQKYIPKINVFILCIPFKLSKKDEDWFLDKFNGNNIIVKIWDEDEIVNKFDCLSIGQTLRESYFGSLALNFDHIEMISKPAYELIKNRWIPELHYCLKAEHEVRRMLFYKDELGCIKNKINYINEQKKHFINQKDFDKDFFRLINKIIYIGEEFTNCLNIVQNYNIDDLHKFRNEVFKVLYKKILIYKRRKNLLSIVLHNTLAEIVDICDLCYKIYQEVHTSAIAILADGGYGKTHFSISLIKNNSIGGVLFLGKWIDSSITFYERFNILMSFIGKSKSNIFEFFIGLNEYGCRENVRVPIVIDGLNESQNPILWKSIISELELYIREKCPNILLVVTLRGYQFNLMNKWNTHTYNDTIYKDVCIPENIKCISLNIEEYKKLVCKYFQYYKINYCCEMIPIELYNPLCLRIFCELKNKNRDKEVRLVSFPYDKTELFDMFCDRIATNIFENNSIINKVSKQEYRNSIRKIGMLIYNSTCSRTIPVKYLFQIFPQTIRSWESDWGNILSHEGLILESEKFSDSRNFEISYDSLAGFLVADWVMYNLNVQSSRSTLINYINSLYQSNHILVNDILSFLCWIYPRKERQRHLFTICHNELRDYVLRKTLDINPIYLNTEVLEEFVKLCGKDSSFERLCYNRIFSNQFFTDQVINMKFLDKILTNKEMSSLDNTWGKWILENVDDLNGIITYLFDCFDEVQEESLSQIFIFLKWLLSTNVQTLRFKALHLIVEFGNKYPKMIFFNILHSLNCKDYYVVEGLALAGYGILMRLYSNNQNQSLLSCGKQYVEKIINDILNHGLNICINSIVLDSFLNSILLLKENFPGQCGQIIEEFQYPYEVSGLIFSDFKNNDIDKEVLRQTHNTIGLNFSNYSITRLLGLRPYETSNEKYLQIRNQILNRMYNLGYRLENFQNEDKNIYNSNYRNNMPNFMIERFAKKYLWIAFKEVESVLKRDIYPNNIPQYLHIDPSYPGMPHKFNFNDSVKYCL